MSYPMHEVDALRQELADSRKKLQEYADTGTLLNHLASGYNSLSMQMTVISLHGELRALRESICSTCKRKFVLLSSEAAADSPSFVNRPQSPAKHTHSG